MKFWQLLATMVIVKPTTQKSYTHLVEWTEGLKRKRAFFSSAKQAANFAARKKEDIKSVAPDEVPPTPDERRAIAEARAHNVPLLEAVAHWRKTVGASQGWTIAKLVESRLQEVEHSHPPLSAVHMRALRLKLGRLVEMIGSLAVSSVGPTDLAPLVYASKSPSGQKHTRAILSGLFAHAGRLGIQLTNPASAVRPQRRNGAAAPPEIFTPALAEQWLKCVAEVAPECLCGWAISMFAGLRRAEIERLSWSEVRIERGFIEVTASKSKTKTRRLVEILPNLMAILKRAGEGTGMVFPHSPRRAEDAARKLLGTKVPKNAARHSFVSYHLAFFGDVAKTELQAGHDRAVLFEHYRELVTKEDAEKYFAIHIPAKSK